MIEHAWIIALLPFVAFLATLFFGKRLGMGASVFGLLATFAGLVMSLAILGRFASSGEPVETSVHWFTLGPLEVEAGTYVDGLTAVMLVVVTLVSLCVQVYSMGYMKGDRRYTWFFAVLSLFTGSMLNLVLANNLIQLLVGWELVGVCSYLLIGHWWEEKENSSAAMKAFITTKTGDVPFLIGIFVLTIAAGTTNIVEISELAHRDLIGIGFLTAGALLLFGGAIGKSAQFPLHVWLPDAMAGPTPVSALIHAATMVAAGVYLVGRMFLVFEAASPVALNVVGIIGCITMLGAALLALIQDDIKKVLAYSTVSQLAYMMAGLSLGHAGYTAGLFHLFTHAFFKALLFLGAGAVIHAVHSNNMSEMGGLRRRMPVTFWTFLIGSLALMGVPPFAGFWSKDEIIAAAWTSGHRWVWAAAVLTAVLTAFYVMRMLLLTFSGTYRGSAQPHESPRVMTWPLMLLAFLSATVGFLGAPQLGATFASWVHVPFSEHETEAFQYALALVSVGGVVLGAFIAYRLYAKWRERDPLRALGPLYTLLDNKYYMDDFYMKGIVKPIQYRLSALANWTNQKLLDGVVNGAGRLARVLAVITEAVDRRAVDGAVNGIANAAGTTGGLLKYVQSGNIQRYLALLFAGIVILTILIVRA